MTAVACAKHAALLVPGAAAAATTARASFTAFAVPFVRRPACHAAVGSLRWQASSASGVQQQQQQQPAVLVVDGGRTSDVVVADLATASDGHTRAVDLLAVGQKAALTALRAVALLRSDGGQVPAFTLDHVEAKEIKPHVRKGFQVRGAHNYRLAVPSLSAWQMAPPSSRPEEEKLLIGTDTQSGKLAQAVAARARVLPEGGALPIEVALGGDKARKRYRVAKMACALAHAYGWQVRPRDPTKPSRPFHLKAAVVVGPLPPRHQQANDAAASGGQSGSEAATSSEVKPPLSRDILRLTVLPHGPEGGSPLQKK